MRRDSPAFGWALTEGLLDGGVDVLPLGQCGTEEVYFHTADSGADAGLMVTASHNPEDYNGFKMVLADAAAATRDNALGAIEVAGDVGSVHRAGRRICARVASSCRRRAGRPTSSVCWSRSPVWLSGR